MKRILLIVCLVLFGASVWAQVTLVDTTKSNFPETDDIIIVIKVPRLDTKNALEHFMPLELSKDGLIRDAIPLYDAGYDGERFHAKTAIKDSVWCLVFLVVPKENSQAVIDILWSYPMDQVEIITADKWAAIRIEFPLYDTLKAKIILDIADSDNRKENNP